MNSSMEKMIRIGMVGGSGESFMGDIHRQAIEKSGCLKLVCGAFGSTRNSSYETGKMLKLPAQRVYGSYRDMFRREKLLPPDEKMELVTIITPNTMHYPVSMSALDAHVPIFCEKPFTCNLDEALNLARKQLTNEVPYGVAMAYAGYPAIRRARELVRKEKILGTLRKVVMSYEMGWLAPRLETGGNRQACWRTDPRRNGTGGCLVDLGAHCFYMAEWLTGERVGEVCGDSRATVPGRILDDDCTVLVRFANGMRGVFLMSQIDTGAADGLSFRIIGEKAALIWSQAAPGILRIRRVDGTEEIEKPGGRASPRKASPVCPPAPFGNNEPYIQALAETYRVFAAYLTASEGKRAELEERFMSVAEGIRSVAFIETVLKNMAEPPQPADGEEQQPHPLPPKWLPVVIPKIPDRL